MPEIARTYVVHGPQAVGSKGKWDAYCPNCGLRENGLTLAEWEEFRSVHRSCMDRVDPAYHRKTHADEASVPTTEDEL